MDKITVFLTLEQVLFIHEEQIDKYGGSHGVRDLALLESAILRAQTTFGGIDLYATIYDKAAALMHSLLLNHPFVDGNKRTAVVSALVFLELNGCILKVTDHELEKFALMIENKKPSIEFISKWLKKHSVKY